MHYELGSNQHAYVKRTSYSDWDSSGATQGAYGNNYPRVGAIRYAGLHNSVVWADQEISQITVALRFLAAGSNSAKTLTFWRGAKSTINGTGQSMIGAEMGSVSVANAYNGVRDIVLSASSNPALFSAFVAWLQDGQTETLVVYRNEGAGSGSWSSNYLKIDATIIYIEYEPKGSKGTLNKTSVDAGQNVSLTIDPLDVSGTVTHRVQWSFGSASSSVTTLPAGTTSTNYTIPMNWCSQIPDAESGQAVCTLTTLVNGSVSATREIPFTVMVPASVVPSFDAAIAPQDTTGGYYQHIGAAQITISNAESQYGAAITAYRIAGGEGTDASTASVTTEPFAQSGDHAYTLTVTDSRGRTASQVVHANVAAVSPVAIQTFAVQRYSTVIGDDGLPDYVASGDGNHVWVTILATADLAGGNNAPTAKILYGVTGGTQTQVNVAWGSNATLSRTDDRTVITAQVPVTDAYFFELVVEDGFSTATLSAYISQSWAALHIPGHGHGLGVGMYAQGTEDDPAMDVAWPIRARGGIQGVTIYSTDEQPTGGIWIDGRPVYRKTISLGAMPAGQSKEFSIGIPSGALGDVVSICGMVQPAGGDYWLPLPHVDTGSIGTWGIKIEIANIKADAKISVGMGSSRACERGFVTIEYTKNTD